MIVIMTALYAPIPVPFTFPYDHVEHAAQCECCWAARCVDAVCLAIAAFIALVRNACARSFAHACSGKANREQQKQRSSHNNNNNKNVRTEFLESIQSTCQHIGSDAIVIIIIELVHRMRNTTRKRQVEEE